MLQPAFDRPAPLETPGADEAAIPTRDYRKYLDPKTLARICSLDLRARLVVEGYITGMHRSPYRGFSIEFAEHRQYVQGDDTRHIDWKVFGRTNKYYIKQYLEETNLACMIAVDCSESMTYKSAHSSMSKHDYAISLAASLTYLALRQQDAVGLALFDEKLTRFVRPNNHPAQWKAVIHELEGNTGPSKTAMGQVLDELAERLRHRTLVIIISDCLNDVEELRKGLKHLRYRKNEIILCQVMDPAELTFPFKGPTRFRGLEFAGQLLCEPRALRERYLHEVQHFISNLRQTCRSLHLDYALYNTQDPLDVALSNYLATRSAGMR
jgi:uncharacterized protein (DUF58 family)